MSNNSEEIVQQIRVHFETLLASVRNTTGKPVSAYEMERRLLTDLLELGRLLLLAFFCAQQDALKGVACVDVGGNRLPLHGLRRRCVLSVFGKVSFMRGYYYQDKQGYFLLDARLNLPKESASDLWRQWRSHLACYSPYHKTGKTLASLLGQRPSARAIEEDHAQDCDLAETFYQEHSAPAPLRRLLFWSFRRMVKASRSSPRSQKRIASVSARARKPAVRRKPSPPPSIRLRLAFARPNGSPPVCLRALRQMRVKSGKARATSGSGRHSPANRRRLLSPRSRSPSAMASISVRVLLLQMVRRPCSTTLLHNFRR